MARDPSVIVFGLDVDDPKAIQGTTRGLLDKYGADRVFGTPLSEDAMTGASIGMALAGLRPIHVHIRMDFLLLAMNQLINVAAKSHYMYGGQVSLPLVVRSMIGKSWGQGAQHSQGLYSFFMHVPGLKVVAPTTPYDAKGCLIAGRHFANAGRMSSRPALPGGHRHPGRSDRSDLAEPPRHRYHRDLGSQDGPVAGRGQRLDLLRRGCRDRRPGDGTSSRPAGH